MGVQHMTTRTEVDPYGVLGTLSPKLAKDLGQAFSLESIGKEKAPKSGRARDMAITGSGAVRFAGQAAAVLLVAGVALALTTGVLYLMGVS